ncbi:AKT-interacting protein-like isoform X2 [Tachypleus tridentatus]|uniref:AKT-interacting protein-like isoform X2 n=1 Tax=Tachypleus tridentatus TaxID=6853 RepID=UPI003FD51368
MPNNYPDGDCPLIVFEPSVFHPLINIETGELDVKRGFQKWRYERDLELFKVKVAESINFCHEKLYDTSTQYPRALCFSLWELTIHDNVRKKLLSGNNYKILSLFHCVNGLQVQLSSSSSSCQ